MTPLKPPVTQTRGASSQGPAEVPVHVAGHGRFLAAFLATLLLSATLLVGVNAWVSPPYDYASYKLDLFARHEGAAYDTLVLGSSRVETFRAEDLAAAGWGRAYNLFVPSSAPEDALALLRHLDATGRLPARVVLGVDHLALVGGVPPVIPGTAAEAIVDGEDPPPLGVLERLRRGFSIEHNLRTVNKLLLDVGIQHQFKGSSSLVDGHYDPPAKRADLAAYAAHQGATSFRPHFEKRPEASAATLDTLRQIAAYAAEKGVRLDVVVMPYHPAALAAFADAPGLVAARAAFREVAPELCAAGGGVFDHTEVGAFGGDPSAFIDGHHVTRANTQRILAAMAEGRGDLCAGPS